MTSIASPVRLSAHAGHAHPATKAGRASCRRTNGQFTPTGSTLRAGWIRTMPGRRFVILDVKATKTGWAFSTNAFRSLLTFAKSPVKYATTVKGATGDWFETRSFLDAPVN